MAQEQEINFDQIIYATLKRFRFKNEFKEDLYQELYVIISDCLKEAREKGCEINKDILYKRCYRGAARWLVAFADKIETHVDVEDTASDSTPILYAHDLLRKLNKKQRHIICLYYGIECKSQSVNKIANYYHVSPRRIYYILEESRKKMHD